MGERMGTVHHAGGLWCVAEEPRPVRWRGHSATRRRGLPCAEDWVERAGRQLNRPVVIRRRRVAGRSGDGPGGSDYLGDERRLVLVGQVVIQLALDTTSLPPYLRAYSSNGPDTASGVRLTAQVAVEDGHPLRM